MTSDFLRAKIAQRVKSAYHYRFSRFNFRVAQTKYFKSLGGKPILKRKKGTLFIVFEGLDGSGSTTQSELLLKYLGKRGKKIYYTSEPTKTLIGGLIGSQLSGQWQSSPQCLQLLFTADRDYHLDKEVTPLLKRGVSVICTRYILSTLAYGNIDIKDEKWLLELNKNMIFPDITFFLKVSPRVCIKRIKRERYHKELFEKERILTKVYKNYIRLSKKFKNIFIINGTQSIEKVSEEIKEITSLFI